MLHASFGAVVVELAQTLKRPAIKRIQITFVRQDMIANGSDCLVTIC
jgi:hypothetical protein